MNPVQTPPKAAPRGRLRPLLAAALLALSWPLAQAHEIAGRPAEDRVVMRAYFSDLARAQAIAHSRFETLESKYELGYVVVNISPAEARELRAQGFRLEADKSWWEQQTQQARRESAALQQQRQQQAQAGEVVALGIPNYSCYPTVEEVFSQADALIAAKPQLARWIDIGDSWQKSRNLGGYDLRVLKLSNSAVAGDKPKLFVNAGIHAREYTTTPLVLEFAKRLVNGHGVDADLSWILDHHEVHLLLVTNPDGRKKAETGLLWRKNTNTAYCGATSNSRGADLNRNFGFGWNSTGGSGSSGNACSETYRGPSGASEPETRAVEAYIRSLWPDRRGPNRGDAAPLDTSGIHLDIHSHGRLLLWPWGTNGTVAGNDRQLATLGRKFAYWNGHTPQRSLSLYETDGTSDGPSYGELGVAAFTFELGTAFFEQCSYYSNTLLPGNLPALIYAAKVARTPYITPAGPDSLEPALSAARVRAGTPVTLTARIDDTRYNNSNGAEPTQVVNAAEYYLDLAPWQAGAVAQPMAAADGSFNAASEAVRATVDTSGLAVGRHIIYLRGRDSAGNWGAPSAVYLDIESGTGGTPPQAAFDYSVNGLTVSFSDRSSDDGSITARSWELGDGSSASGTNPVKTYAAAGSYNVRLTVTDNEGLSANTSRSVVLSDDGVPVLLNSVGGLAGAARSWRYWKVAVPAGTTQLQVRTSGGSGDLDLFTQPGQKPTASSYNCKKEGSTNLETCSLSNPAPGWLYIGLYGYRAYSGASLQISYTP